MSKFFHDTAMLAITIWILFELSNSEPARELFSSVLLYISKLCFYIASETRQSQDAAQRPDDPELHRDLVQAAELGSELFVTLGTFLTNQAAKYQTRSFWASICAWLRMSN